MRVGVLKVVKCLMFLQLSLLLWNTLILASLFLVNQAELGKYSLPSKSPTMIRESFLHFPLLGNI